MRLYPRPGHPEADRVVVAMGSATSTIQEAVDHLNASGERTGLLKVRLYRPWDAEAFRAANFLLRDALNGRNGLIMSFLPPDTDNRISGDVIEKAREAARRLQPYDVSRFYGAD